MDELLDVGITDHNKREGKFLGIFGPPQAPRFTIGPGEGVTAAARRASDGISADQWQQTIAELEASGNEDPTEAEIRQAYADLVSEGFEFR